MKNWMILAALLVPLAAVSGVAASLTGFGGARLVASIGEGPQIIFLNNGRTIQAQTIEPHGESLRVQTPGGPINLPSSRVRSIHPMDSPTDSPGSPPPAQVYHGLTQQMTDQVRGEIQSQAPPAQAR